MAVQAGHEEKKHVKKRARSSKKARRALNSVMINNLSTPPSECNINATSSSHSRATPQPPIAHKLF